ncbi:MAG TPA: division/cell wall cluster transcriptional repressor MraZ [Candidatus Eubacterium pullicola]|uniref:Transcriptional regulator MraZ n=1 Tax=Gallibacter intestinalis TaxID=2779356 RepID=A0ABR9QY41_9FIRM|nr:division/cell wall cluster transcriptional repressor MraZ [Gallibacter intestinalis]MBE5035797.1 division/cell wall cluster transcriptional repressor MraZ [Gallibacter intestinalis]HIW39405.1 division/cell wall cluster transcriptional repressor MraZ [Candidatus Eubacterium pullicola]
MFIGTYNNSIDAKNRMIVPAKFREELGYKVVLTLGIDNCIYLYPMKEWEVFMEKLAKLPISDPKARNFARNFTGNAEECEVDRQGRITLPQNLREQTGMVKELTTIGCMNKIEIWSREEYEGAGDQVQMDRGEIAKGMVEYGI